MTRSFLAYYATAILVSALLFYVFRQVGLMRFGEPMLPLTIVCTLLGMTLAYWEARSRGATDGLWWGTMFILVGAIIKLSMPPDIMSRWVSLLIPAGTGIVGMAIALYLLRRERK